MQSLRGEAGTNAKMGCKTKEKNQYFRLVTRTYTTTKSAMVTIYKLY